MTKLGSIILRDLGGASEDEPFNPDNFVAQPIVKTTIGTTPEGSEWAKVNLPSELVGK